MSGPHSRRHAATCAACALSSALTAHAQIGTPAASQASAPLPFRRDDVSDPGFPVAGAVLLLALIGVAAGVWWLRHRRSGAWLQRLVAPAAVEVRVVSSVRLDVNTRLHVVEWKRRQLLVAVQGTGAPVVLDCEEAVSVPVEPMS